MELNHLKKNKICLSDYDYQKDIENRILLSEFSQTDFTVLEEIIYSPLTFSTDRLFKSLEISKEEILSVLEKLIPTGLLSLEGNQISIDKEMRKYFESQVLKFEDDFIPDLEFLHSMLKKVPIHVLPVWYSIPRTSDNIFQSLIEKYFQTPQAFQRYLMEINLGDPILSNIVQDVFSAPSYKVPSETIMQKYDLTKQRFEEYLLLLEFNFLCCLAYDHKDERWVEVVTPFKEWRDYLLFLEKNSPHSLSTKSKLIRNRPTEFAFVNDMSTLLQEALNKPLSIKKSSHLISLLQNLSDSVDSQAYCNQVLDKLKLLKMAAIADDKLFALEGAHDFLAMQAQNRALFVYRHPLNNILLEGDDATLWTERNLREAEKSITRIATSGWVYFDEFLKGSLIPLSEETRVVLKRQGRSWKYSLPNYSPAEKHFIHTIIFKWLFEAGIVAIGCQDERDCFCVTPFGQTLFS
jgi:predicted transcriptional regulator